MIALVDRHPMVVQVELLTALPLQSGVLLEVFGSFLHSILKRKRIPFLPRENLVLKSPVDTPFQKSSRDHLRR